MREFRIVLLLLVMVIGVALFGACVLALESEVEGDCFAIRGSVGAYGFPVSSGDFMLEGAFSICDVSVSAWAEMQALPLSISGFGGELALTKEWLSLSLLASLIDGECVTVLTSRAEPPAWLVIDSDFSLLLGVTASATATLCGGIPDSEIAFSHVLTGVLPISGAVVKPSLALDCALGSQELFPSIVGSRVASSVEFCNVIVSGTAFFTGVFDVLSSVVVTVCIPDCNLAFSGALVPTGLGKVIYRLGISYEFGNSSLLPAQVGAPGQICTDDVCY